jgi:hypothetical protein
MATKRNKKKELRTCSTPYLEMSGRWRLKDRQSNCSTGPLDEALIAFTCLPRKSNRHLNKKESLSSGCLSGPVSSIKRNFSGICKP